MAGWKRLISRSTINYAGTNKAFVVSESRDKVCLRAIALRFPPPGQGDWEEGGKVPPLARFGFPVATDREEAGACSRRKGDR